jgi:Cdc6-like AAA superfamily ATPase
MVKVWGMTGVGKTTLVREVAKQAMEEKFFDEVAIANVTQSPNLTQIQGEVAKMLGLKFDEVTVPRRASRLQNRLTKTKDEKMILVVLGDIWKSLNLEDIGIPSEGCKVLLTSRD